MRKIRIVTFTPLCYTLIGMQAIKNYNLKPFIDSSCRREPDFENEFPSITALCRTNKLAPQLKEEDIVVYLSKPGKYKCSEKYMKRGRYYLVSILEVIKICNSHEEAKRWYAEQNIPLPNNCMVDGNIPNSFSRTGGNFKNQRDMKIFLKLENEEKDIKEKSRIRAWDSHYQKRARKHPQFVITRPIYKKLESPLEISKNDLVNWFGKVPNTLSPKIISQYQFEEIKHKASLY